MKQKAQDGQWHESDADVEQETLRTAVGCARRDSLPEPCTVFPDHCQDGAKLDYDLENLARIIIEIEQITYEKKNESDLYCVDGKTLIHVAEKEQLIGMLNQLSKKASPTRETAGHTSIATKYARIIQSFTNTNHDVA